MASFCPNCGSPLPDFGKFCPKCGQVLNAEPAPQGEEYQTPPEQYQSQYAYQPEQGGWQQQQAWQQQGWQQPAPKKGKGGLIAVLVVLLLAALAAIACFVWPGFLNKDDAGSTDTPTTAAAPTDSAAATRPEASTVPVETAPVVTVPVETFPVNPFLDVSSSDPCYAEYLWAYNNGIISGDVLNADQAITRGEVMELLWKVFGRPAPRQTDMPFTDVSSSDSCYSAVLWAYSTGLVSGAGEGLFNPNASMTRDQVAAVLFKAMNGDASGLPQAYTDVDAEQYYYNAVNWGCAQGILERGSDFLFRPSDPLLRGVFVCWLARAMNPELALEPATSHGIGG